MNRVQIEDIPGKGKGVLAAQSLTTDTQIYGLNNFTLASISTSLLSDFCYHCYAASKYHGEWCSIGQYHDAELKVCTGCNIARFCGKHCQTLAWKTYHKHECKIYSRLYPKILPESVRAAIRFALQHKHGLLPNGAWTGILQLMSHHKEIQDAEGTVFMDLMLMAKAASEYSKASDQTTFFLLLCILKTNGMTLQATSNDPIGVFLDPFLALFNHSCDPNTALHRPAHTNSTGWPQRKQPAQCVLSVMTLRPIGKGEELTLPYVDFQHHVSKRQTELLRDYFFKCTCTKCTADLAAENNLKSSNLSLAKAESSWRQQADAILETLAKPTLSATTIASAVQSFETLISTIESQPDFHPAQDPYSRVTQELKLLYNTTNNSTPKRTDMALICALKQYLVIDPRLYNSQIYPTRIVNAIYLLQLLALFHHTSDRKNGQDELWQQWQNLKTKGLMELGVKYWRLRICADMRQALAQSVAVDLVEVFEMEQVSVGAGDEAEINTFLGIVGVKEQAEEQVRLLMGIDTGKWQEISAELATRARF